MSAFSNWNGPGGCGGGGGTLPQIQTLESLIAALDQLSQIVNADKSTMEDHITDTVASKPGLHGIQTSLDTLKQDIMTLVNNLLGPDTNPGTIRYLIKQNENAIATLQTNTSWTIGKENEYARMVNVLSGFLGATINVRSYIDTIDAKIGPLGAYPTVADKIDSVIQALSQFRHDLIAGAPGMQIRVPIQTEEDIQTGKINVSELIDFDKWYRRAVALRPVANVGGGQQVAILGYLSQDYRPSQSMAPGGSHKDKPAIAFIKYINDRPWNAVVNMTATSESPDIWQGSISALASKSGDRRPYPNSDTGPYPPLRFGLYVGSLSDSSKCIYLGVQCAETYPTLATSFITYVAGINFKALDPAHEPNGGVNYITHCDITENGELSANNLGSSGKIKVDIYEDTKGNRIWNIDGNTLNMGDVNLQLKLYSTDRPDVEHLDGSKHQLAYLSDISNSIYWQKTIDYIFADLAEANNQKVYFDSNGTCVPPNSSTIDPTKTRNGVYTTNPYSDIPTYKLFEADETALLRKGGTSNNGLADGRYNGTFTSGSGTYQSSAISGINDLTFVKPGTASLSTLDGTILEDNAGNFAKITSDPVGAATFTAIGFMPPPFFSYDLPAYATYINGAWQKDATGDIPIPTTFDKIVHDVTYEWSGRGGTTVKEGPVQQFHDTFTTWTAHYQNTITMDFVGPAWDHVEINLEGYRNSAAQDKIDDYLAALATAQPDYAEIRQTIPVQLPERPTPESYPNPAYIHNKPWTGVAIVDGGTFIDPLLYAGWALDGGDFTGLHGQTQPPGNPPVVSASYKNVIIRIWHGMTSDEPETQSTPLPGVWENFGWTFRWLTDKQVLRFNDPEHQVIHEWVPFSKDEKTKITTKLPDPPLGTDGRFALVATVASGAVTYAWEAV
jgi:hypothetical protein